MKQLKYLVIHCSATKPDVPVNYQVLSMWHKAPKDMPDGSVRYLGKIYPSRAALPDDKIAGYPIDILKGRGWSRLGYSDIIHRDGSIENITRYNDNNYVEYDEMTWGAAGYNAVARHVCLEGGLDERGFSGQTEFLRLFTPEQYKTLFSYCKDFLIKHPEAKVVGHYHLNPHKTCPNFRMDDYLYNLKIAINGKTTHANVV